MGCEDGVNPEELYVNQEVWSKLWHLIGSLSFRTQNIIFDLMAGKSRLEMGVERGYQYDPEYEGQNMVRGAVRQLRNEVWTRMDQTERNILQNSK